MPNAESEREIAEWAISLMSKRMAPYGAYLTTARKFGVTPEYVKECVEKVQEPRRD